VRNRGSDLIDFVHAFNSACGKNNSIESSTDSISHIYHKNVNENLIGLFRAGNHENADEGRTVLCDTQSSSKVGKGATMSTSSVQAARKNRVEYGIWH